MKQYTYYVYIVTNFNNTTFYIGVTNDLERRIFEHKDEIKFQDLFYLEDPETSSG